MNRFLLPLLALGCFATHLNAGSISYTVTVNSSAISSSTPGFIEFQFNQANASTSLAATASVSGFTPTGFTLDNTSNASLGLVTGSLQAPPLVLDNTGGGSNLYDQGVSQFGSGFSFNVTLNGAALDATAPDGSGFFVYLLDSAYGNLAGPDGTVVASISINGDTTVTPYAVAGLSTVAPYTAPVDSSPDAPEPSTFALFGLASVLIISVRALSFPKRDLQKIRIS